MLTPVYALYQLVGVTGSIQLYPPSPAFTSHQPASPGAASEGEVAIVPLSWVPPIRVSGSVGWFVPHTNCDRGPMWVFRLSNALAFVLPSGHVPVCRFV